jgi:DNA-damage-inducible protein D
LRSTREISGENYRSFNSSVASCETSGNNPAHHFAGAGKMIALGKGGQREVDDYQLSRFACYHYRPG